MGDRLSHIRAAIAAVGEHSAVAAVSPIYETAPLGVDGQVVHDQAAFLNCVVAIDTHLGPSALRAAGAQIERDLGRPPGERWQPRPIDIDLVLYGDARIGLPDEVVPHPRMFERAFVIRPLVDLDPEISVPGRGKLRDLLPTLSAQPCKRTIE
jgi:2-amino-4-hydroxy-6-hydroxymethyldihydropteridine diphosphokinase